MKLKTEIVSTETLRNVKRYVFDEFELKNLLIDTFQSGAMRVLNIEDKSLSVSNYINDLFKKD